MMMTTRSISDADANLLTARQAAARLGVSRSTFYTIAWLRQRAIYVRPKSPRWDPRDLELFKALHGAKERVA